MKVTMAPIVVGALETVTKSLEGIDDLSKNQDHLDHNTVKISKNTEKSFGDLSKLAVT